MLGHSFLKRARRRLLRSIDPAQWLDDWHAEFVSSDAGEYEISKVASFIDRNRAAVDVGSLDGVYARHFVDNARKVYVFEANPICAEFLRKALPREVVIENVALSNGAGSVTLRVPKHNGRAVNALGTIESSNDLDFAQVKRFQVPTKSLDEFDLQDVGFMKIDVEGHEEAVVAGAEKLLDRWRPALMIEIEERHNSGGVARITEHLEGMGYEGRFFDTSVPECPLRRISEFSLELHQQAAQIAQFGQSPRRRIPYVNNFIYTQRMS